MDKVRAWEGDGCDHAGCGSRACGGSERQCRCPSLAGVPRPGTGDLLVARLGRICVDPLVPSTPTVYLNSLIGGSVLSILKSLRFFPTAICALAVLCACDGTSVSPQTLPQTNPVPAISTLLPSSAAAGSPALTLAVTGSGFVAASTVTWNGVALATSYVDASHLTATVLASDLTAVDSASVTVFNPSPGGGTSGALIFTINESSSPSVRQSAEYTGYPGANSTSWKVTLNNVQARSTIYVVGTWPNFASTYPTMGVTDTGTNTYIQLDRHDDTMNFTLGIKGTQSMGHWYAANVKAGSYTINMAPSPATFEDWVALAAFEIAGVAATPLDGHALNLQARIPPGINTVTATVTNVASSGILVAVTFDDIDSTAPTVPLAGSGFGDLGSLGDFRGTGKFAPRAGDYWVLAPGAHTATFSPQEGGQQSPDYMTPAAIFH